jgi:hypothetical protein
MLIFASAYINYGDILTVRVEALKMQFLIDASTFSFKVQPIFFG